jgi:hypothetical protein
MRGEEHAVGIQFNDLTFTVVKETGECAAGIFGDAPT